jgi:hypothetical protein
MLDDIVTLAFLKCCYWNIFLPKFVMLIRNKDAYFTNSSKFLKKLCISLIQLSACYAKKQIEFLYFELI